MMVTPRRGTLEGERTPLRDASGRRYWRGKVTLFDGSKARVDIPEPKCFSRTAARDHVAFCQEEEDRTHAIFNSRTAARNEVASSCPGSEGESVATWFGRYYEWRAARPTGAESVGDSRGRFKKWIAPKIGPLAMRAVTREILEDLVATLDDAVGDEKIAPKTAINIFGEVTAGFAVAATCKDRSLRVLDRNPAEGISGPDDGVTKQKPFLRPDEITKLLSSPAVPAERRQVYAVAIYTAMRQGELRALRVRDIDLDAMQITVARQMKNGREKERTKTGRARIVQIEPNLVPLLRILIDGKEDDDRILSVGAHNRCASHLRADLEVADCKREALHVSKNDAMRARMKFHNLRDTCLTHMAVRRDPPQDVQWRAGHTTSTMTEAYITNARYNAGANFGTPLPPLPDDLGGPPPRSTQSPPTSPRALESHAADDVAALVTSNVAISRAMTSPDVFDSRRLHHCNKFEPDSETNRLRLAKRQEA